MTGQDLGRSTSPLTLHPTTDFMVSLNKQALERTESSPEGFEEWDFPSGLREGQHWTYPGASLNFRVIIRPLDEVFSTKRKQWSSPVHSNPDQKRPKELTKEDD